MKASYLKEHLTAMFRRDPKAISNVFDTHFECNEQLGDSDLVVCSAQFQEFKFSPLGILNSMLEDREEYVVAKKYGADNKLIGFCVMDIRDTGLTWD